MLKKNELLFREHTHKQATTTFTRRLQIIFVHNWPPVVMRVVVNREAMYKYVDVRMRVCAYRRQRGDLETGRRRRRD